MTDNEIIKALGICSDGTIETTCADCPYDGNFNCSGLLKKDALNLIENIRADAVNEIADAIEKELELTMKRLSYISETLVEVSKCHITESRALDKIRDYLQGTISSRSQLERTIDNLVKEMVGDSNA